MHGLSIVLPPDLHSHSLLQCDVLLHPVHKTHLKLVDRLGAILSLDLLGGCSVLQKGSTQAQDKMAWLCAVYTNRYSFRARFCD